MHPLEGQEEGHVLPRRRPAQGPVQPLQGEVKNAAKKREVEKNCLGKYFRAGQVRQAAEAGRRHRIGQGEKERQEVVGRPDRVLIRTHPHRAGFLQGRPDEPGPHRARWLGEELGMRHGDDLPFHAPEAGPGRGAAFPLGCREELLR